MTDPQQPLLDLLAPILARVAALELPSASAPERVAALEATLEAEFPYAGEHVQAIGQAIARGIDDGWLANRGEPESRFSRLAKPSDATHGLSIDVVSMVGAGLEHTHPAGEITIGFPAHAGLRGQFEGRAPGWVVLGPGSRHVPRVDGERMNLIYFLPAGAVNWHRPGD
jgi:hypothetical protein